MLPVRTTISCRFPLRVASLFILTALTTTAVRAAERASTVLPLVIRWSVDIAAPPMPGVPPVADEEHVYVALRSAQIIARDVADGRERWQRPVATDQPMAADGGFLFVATADALKAFRAADGVIAWETPVGHVTAPLLARAGWLIAMAGGKALAFREQDGSPVWQRDIGNVAARPAIDGDRLYVPADGRVVSLDLTTGSTVWEQTIGGAPEMPFVYGDHVYAGSADKYFYCLRLKNGEVAWRWRTGAAIQGVASADESRVFFTGRDNLVWALDRETGVQKWHQALRRRPGSGPALLGATLLIPSYSSAEIWALTPDGKTAATIAIPAEPAVPPAFVEMPGQRAAVYVVSGSLANRWQLTRLATGVDPPLLPLSGLPGSMLAPERWPIPAPPAMLP